MDTQMKKGLLDVCVLAVIAHSDSYGYQIIRDVSPCVKISESTLYPILKRLETGGCLTTYSVAHSGRLRKYYRITPLGRERLSAFRREWEEMVRIHDFILQEGKPG
ncbi:MAG: PadR family transcriptional regulator [Oscillospiraceae bacterium]|nr:PadR family transcriptional regulator [Oscillospiraceae bacterium]